MTQRVAVLGVGNSSLGGTHSSIAAYRMIDRVAATKPQLIRGAKALLVHNSTCLALLLLLLKIKEKLSVPSVRSLGYRCLSWAYQVRHCTQLVGSPFNSFALN